MVCPVCVASAIIANAPAIGAAMTAMTAMTAMKLRQVPGRLKNTARHDEDTNIVEQTCNGDLKGETRFRPRTRKDLF